MMSHAVAPSSPAPETKGGLPGLENKAGRPGAEPVQPALDELATAFEAFKETNDTRLAQIEGRLGPDVLTEEKRARIDAQKAEDAAAFGKGGDPQPETKNMTPAQKRAEAKRIAEEVFAKQGTKGLGSDGIH